ncbi:unnamed protein product [Leuciscus chuanchicus]
MLLEGVQLYRMVVLVFHTTAKQLYMYAVGYGVPLVIVIISAISYPRGYGTDRQSFTVTAVAQLCVLGGTWVFGFFLFQENGTEVMLYLFTILNSLQGVLIFIMHCLLSKQVRAEYYYLFVRMCPHKKKAEYSISQSNSSQLLHSSFDVHRNLCGATTAQQSHSADGQTPEHKSLSTTNEDFSLSFRQKIFRLLSIRLFSESIAQDEDECATSPSVCGDHSECVNTHGSYSCACVQGFIMSVPTQCTDVNKCPENEFSGSGNMELKSSTGSEAECDDINKCANKTFSGSGDVEMENTTDTFVTNLMVFLGLPVDDDCIREDCGVAMSKRHCCVHPVSKTHLIFLRLTRVVKIVFAMLNNIDECKDPDVCGTNAVCKNHPGSFVCECSLGYSNYGNNQSKCIEMDCDQFKPQPDAEHTPKKLKHLMSLLKNSCESLNNTQGEHFTGEELLENFCNSTDDLLSDGNIADGETLSQFLSTVENSMHLIGPQLKEPVTRTDTHHTFAEVAVRRGQAPPSGRVTLSTDSAFFNTSWETVVGKSYPGFAFVALVSFKDMNSSSDQFHTMSRERSDDRERDITYQLNSKVVTVVVSNPETKQLSEPVTIIFTHEQTYVNNLFIDYEKAFDSVDRRTLWKLLRHYGVPIKITDIIQNSYDGLSCRVIHDTQATDNFQVWTDVRQGCLLFPFLFLLTIDWVMRTSTAWRRNGIQWTLWKQLADLDFADDLALLSHTQQQMQEKTNTVAENSLRIGLNIHKGKTKVLKVNPADTAPIKLEDEVLEEAEIFTYLSSVVDKQGGTDADVRVRIGKARTAFQQLKKVWDSSALTIHTKIKLFNTIVKPILLYGAETWRTTASTMKRIQTLINTCLKRILRIRGPERAESEGVVYSCVFWNETEGAWSGKACEKVWSNDTHSMCSYSHLSSFALLMALYPVQDTFELVLITRVGLVLSLLCLFLCILTFRFCRSIQGTRNSIHLHLSVCLFIADLVFLCGISSTHNQVACAIVAALLHFFFLSAFCWMLLEGVQLYRMVVLVFHTTVKHLYMYAMGYGVPLVIVIISAIAFPKGYGTQRHCWLSLDRFFILSFFAPVCIIVILNCFFFIITVWKLAKKFSSLNPDLSKLKQIRSFTVTAVAQLCVLGGTWVFGFFLFQENGTEVMLYLFTILNSFQGALIFIMHCLLSKQVRTEYYNLFGRMCPHKKKAEYHVSQSNSSQKPLRSDGSTAESQI